MVPGYDVLRRRLEDSTAWFAGYVTELPLKRHGEWLRFRFADGCDGGMMRQEILFRIVNHGTYYHGAIGHVLGLAGAPRPADTCTLYTHSAQPERREQPVTMAVEPLRHRRETTQGSTEPPRCA